MPLGISEKQEREIMRESKSKGKEKTGEGKWRRGGSCYQITVISFKV